MHNSASVLESDTLLWDFDVQTDHLTSARRPDLQNCGTNYSGWSLNKTEGKWKEVQVPVPCLGIEKTVEHDGDNYINRDWCFWFSHQKITKGTERLGNKRTSEDHPNYYIIENDQNTEKSPGDLRKLPVTQTPVKDHQLKLMWKTLKE